MDSTKTDAPTPSSIYARVLAVLRLLRTPAVNMAFLTMGLLVSLFFAEAAARVVAPQQLILIRPDLWRPADTVSHLHQPNIDIEVNTGERTARILTDAEGFRVGPEGRVEADKTVLLLGDSFMEALQVDWEQSGAGLLQDALARQLGEPVAVRNAGVGGWNLDHYRLRAEQLLASGDYDLVITSVVVRNDIVLEPRDYFPPRAPGQRYPLRLPRALSWGEFTDAILRPVNDFLEVRSHAFLFFKNRLGVLRMQTGLVALEFPRVFLKSEASSDRWSKAAQLLNEIDSLAAERGIPSVQFLVPDAPQVDSLSFIRSVRGFGLDEADIEVDQPNRLLGQELADREILFYDLLPAFREAHREGVQLYGRVDPHMSPEGNELFARLVAPPAAELLMSASQTQATSPPGN